MADKTLSKLISGYEKEIDIPIYDNLTGLFNHGFFQVALSQAIKTSLRYLEPFTFALIDINAFSRFNQQHGSLEGDRTLKAVAAIIKENIREVDLAARYHDDLFALILTKISRDQSIEAAERIKKAISDQFKGKLTVSIILTSFPRDADNSEDLKLKAHDTLMQTKIKGSNEIFFFEKEEKTSDVEKPRILVVDDEPVNVKLLEVLLDRLNYEVIKAFDGAEALSIISKMRIDLILLDIMMPGMNGIEACRRIKQSEATRMIPVIIVTSLDDMESKVAAIEAGADDFLTKPPDRIELLARTKSLINVKKLNDSLIGFESTLFSLANAVEAKDAYTKGHIQRVSKLAADLGKMMRLSSKEIEALRIGGILHDLGKIGIADHILNKPGSLNDEEWEIMRQHPDVGFKIAYPLKRNLKQALDVIRHHHERMDGSGYPDGIKGDEISVVARVMAVVDCYDALTTSRPYQQGRSTKEAFDILQRDALNGKLDEKVVATLGKMMNAEISAS